LIDNGHNVAIIEINPATAARLTKDLPPSALVIEGDGCDAAILEDAGSATADMFVATTGRDDDNLVSCELVQTIFDIPRCIARVNNPRNERIFRRMGIESVSSTTVISRLIEEEALAGTFNAMKDLRNNDVCMIEMRIPGGGDETLAKKGIKVGDIELPRGSLVGAVEKDGNLEVATLDMRVFPGDKVILLSQMSMAEEVRELLRNL
ncbi:MAG: potassium channel family protein, partial [Coriobacteriales bacterium]